LKITEEIDTIVCPAQEWGFEKVFLKQHRWYAVDIAKSKIPIIKYIAIYEKKPVKAIRYIGKVKEIKPYKKTGKYEIVLKDKPLKIKPIKRSKENPRLAPQNRQYTNKKLIDDAEWLEDIFHRKRENIINS